MTDQVDPVTGEVLPRAADGKMLLPPASTLSQFIAALSEGEFDRGMANVLIEMVRDLRDHATAGDGTAKGKLALNFEIKLEGGAFFISPNYKVTIPAEKHPRALMFATEDGRFTPNAPLQGALFGVRDVAADRRFRNA
jgi:hypothetical protein